MPMATTMAMKMATTMEIVIAIEMEVEMAMAMAATIVKATIIARTTIIAKTTITVVAVVLTAVMAAVMVITAVAGMATGIPEQELAPVKALEPPLKQRRYNRPLELWPSTAYFLTTSTIVSRKASQTHASKNGSPPASRYSSRLAAHTNGVGDKHGGAYYSGSASRSGLPTSASTNALSGGFGTDTGNQDQQQHTPLGGAGTFASSYLPTISAVLYRMIWDVVANSFTLLEPFRLLARPEGASSAALFSAYQKKPHLLECIRNHHWPLGIITIASSLADLLPALASESVLVNTDWPGCPNRHLDSPMNPCPRRVEVLVTVIRSMQALLAFACVILLWLLAFFFFGSTGLADDPSSIAAVASLMSNDGLLQDLNRIPGNADTGEMRRLLSHNQYRLGYFEAEPGEIRYGIEPGAYSDDLGIVTLAHKYGPIVDRSGLSSRRKRRPQNNWVLDVILLVFILG